MVIGSNNILTENENTFFENFKLENGENMKNEHSCTKCGK